MINTKSTRLACVCAILKLPFAKLKQATYKQIVMLLGGCHGA